MIEFKQGNIFDQDVDVIVNPVNCVGVMGAGLAKQFKSRYPGNFTEYKKACDADLVRIGKGFLYRSQSSVDILNFPTKDHWREPSQLDFIKQGMNDMVLIMRKFDYKSIAIPPLGSGLGGLDWSEVRSVLQYGLTYLPNVHAIILGSEE